MKKSRVLIFLLVLVFSLTSVTFADSLKYGSKGTEVTKLQKQLKKLGYFSSSITGYFGNETKAAVKKFQAKKGISTTGTVGPQTTKALYVNGTSSVSAAGKKQITTAKESLKKVQAILKQMGLYKGKIDGLNGKLTTAAVKGFQAKYKLKATGVIDKNTEGKILNHNTVTVAANRGGTAAGGSTSTTRIEAVEAKKEEAQLLKAEAVTAEDDKSAGSGAAVEAEAISDSEALENASLDGAVPSEGEEESQGLEEDTNTEPAETNDKIEVLDWWTQASKVFARGTTAKVIDVRTGKSFYVKRTYGSNHADSETLTKEDTSIMKEIWGGQFSWSRRPVILEIDGRLLAASMAGMPHAGLDNKPANITVSGRSQGYGRGANLDTVKKNGMDGHFDIHFKNSRTHGTNRVDAAHQKAIKEAAAAKL